MTAEEKLHADELLRVMKNTIAAKDSSVTGFNVGMNCGESAGQTVMHAHIHLIPRRVGDAASPRGGVRGVIPERMSYE
jgi:diadenosine tetraphosphate (Ap4A) HIT family hydrolase